MHTITNYQIVDQSTCRFIYRCGHTNTLRVVSVENYLGMIDFLKSYEGAVRLDDTTDIHQFAKTLNETEAWLKTLPVTR